MGSIFHEGWYRENPMQNYSAWKAESCVKDVQINHQTMMVSLEKGVATKGEF